MTAAVETMMYSNEVPWHGLGTYVGDNPILAEEAIAAAGLDWEVKKLPAFAEDPQPDGTTIRCETKDHFLTVRSSDHKVLGQVQGKYEVVQNKSAFEFVDAIVGSSNMVRYHTAGALHGGRQVWMLAEVLNLTIAPVPGDETKPYLLLVNGHDGRMPLKVLFTTVRVVCSNTLNLALKTNRTGITIRHVKGLEAKKSAAQEVLGFAQREVAEFSTLAGELVKSQVDFDKFLNQLIPLGDDEPTRRRVNIREKIRELYLTGPGTEIQGVAGTRWAALQAVTAYTTHFRTTVRAPTNDEKRMQRLESSWFGVGNDLNQKALELLTP